LVTEPKLPNPPENSDQTGPSSTSVYLPNHAPKPKRSLAHSIGIGLLQLMLGLIELGKAKF